jgi:glycosyltransferase involved in cell wall biosynthesis
LIRGSGIDVEAFDRSAKDEQRTTRLREHLGLTASNIVITVTRIEPLKGIGTLLAAAELVQDVNPDTQVLLVGPWEDGDARHARLRDLCERSRSLRWIGPRSDIHALLRLACVFVLPTEFREGLPRVLLEAALAELPIVTTDMPGCMSVVEHGRNGFIVPPRAPGAVAAALLELLASPELWRAFGRNGSDHVRQHFSLDRVVDDYATLYRTLHEPGPSGSPRSAPAVPDRH